MTSPENMETPENKEVDQLKAELDSLRKDFTQLTDTFKQMSREQVQAGTDQARDSAQQLGNQARDAAQNVEQEISARPLTSVLAAFGIGFIVGKLLDR